MSDQLEDRLIKLEELIKAQSAPKKVVDVSNKYIKWIQSIVALVIVVVGMGTTWGLTQGKITSLETDVATLKGATATERQMTKVERDTLRNDFITMQVKQASVDQLLNGIREDVTEIRGDVKKLIQGR